MPTKLPLLALVLAVIFVPWSAKANTYTYVYTGSPMTSCSGPGCVTSAPFPEIIASFTLDSPLGENLPYQSITPISWEITDGIVSLINTNAQLEQPIAVATVGGVITQWDFFAEQFTASNYTEMYTSMISGSIGEDASLDQAPNSGPFTPLTNNANFGAPGTWTETETATVPSDRRLRGPYSFLVNNWLSNPSDSPVGHLGIVNFDGAGNLTITDTINASGTVGTFAGIGTYSLAKNGTGTLSFTLPDAGLSVTNAIVVDSAGKSIQILTTSCSGCSETTDVYSGTAYAMGASSFTNASLEGTYEWNMEKWTSSQSPTAVCRVAAMTFDGVGKVTFSGTANTGGTVASYTGSGTYSVNSDGSGTINLVFESGSSLILSIVVNSASATGLGAKGLQHLNTASTIGYINAGTATKQ